MIVAAVRSCCFLFHPTPIRHCVFAYARAAGGCSKLPLVRSGFSLEHGLHFEVDFKVQNNRIAINSNTHPSS